MMSKQPNPMEIQPDHAQMQAAVPMSPAPSASGPRPASTPAINKSQAEKARKRSLKKQRAAQMTSGEIIG